ncbi:MAG: hypothetical protein ACKV2U_11440 [Bryobacteraceae bacterium]
MIFLPAFDWLIAGGMIVAVFLVIIIALLVNPPTALVNKMQGKNKDQD